VRVLLARCRVPYLNSLTDCPLRAAKLPNPPRSWPRRNRRTSWPLRVLLTLLSNSIALTRSQIGKSDTMSTGAPVSSVDTHFPATHGHGFGHSRGHGHSRSKRWTQPSVGQPLSSLNGSATPMQQNLASTDAASLNGSVLGSTSHNHHHSHSHSHAAANHSGSCNHGDSAHHHPTGKTEDTTELRARDISVISTDFIPSTK
jgi:hypothetical protein